ncbi:MAG TPA: hypothetical protein VMF33_06430 [Acidimicrobiales bacterium]|nr:hypothetical protein [Acidimicrobiales bacterium]
MLKTRAVAIALSVVALGLTVTGVVIAATDSNPADLAKDSLVLNGYPPTSAQLAVTVSTGSDVSVDATVNVNFKTDRISAVARVPLVITTASVDLVFARDELFARSADVQNGPWFKAAVTTPPLFGFSLEFTKPDIDLISGFHKTVSTSGYSTTYVFTRHDVALSSVFAPANAYSVLGSVFWSITVGSQGEVTASTLVEHARHLSTTITATVLSYNKPARISVPTSANSRSLSTGGLSGLLDEVNFNSLLIPSALRSLGQTSIS